MDAAVSDTILPVETLHVPFEIIGGPESVCSATALLRATVRLLMPCNMFSTDETCQHRNNTQSRETTPTCIPTGS